MVHSTILRVLLLQRFGCDVSQVLRPSSQFYSSSLSHLDLPLLDPMYRKPSNRVHLLNPMPASHSLFNGRPSPVESMPRSN